MPNKLSNEEAVEIVSRIEWLAWADGLVTQEESLKIILNVGIVTGAIWWDVSELPQAKRKPVLDMIQRLDDGTHPVLRGNYKPANPEALNSNFPTVNEPVLHVPPAFQRKKFKA